MWIYLSGCAGKGHKTDAWQVTRIARQRYYVPVLRERRSWEEPGVVDYEEAAILEDKYQGSDVYALRVQHEVSVTPISLDLTSRVDLGEIDHWLRKGDIS